MSQEHSKPYKYFDTPDGEDVWKKFKCVFKPTVATAFMVATTEVMLYSHPKGYMPTLARYAYIGIPIIGISSAFVGTTNLAASLRKKDDTLNWFIGGFAAGSVFGVWSRRAIIGFNMGMFLGIMAALKKYTLQQGWEFHPGDDFKIAATNVWANTDYTLTAHRPGNWTTTKEQ